MNNQHPKIHVTYPPLVEQAATWLKVHGHPTDRAEVYARMVAADMIDERGNATQAAIDDRLVVVNPYHFAGSDPDPERLADFKAAHPVYQHFDDSHFVRAGGKWCVDASVVRVIAAAALESPETPARIKRCARAILSDMEVDDEQHG